MSVVSMGLMAATALMLTLVLMPVSIRLAQWTGAVDHPDTRKVHSRVTPRLGGIAIGIAFIFICLFFLGKNHEVLGLVIGTVVIALTGLIDDIWHIRPWQKFLGEIAAASVFLHISGVELHTLGNLVGSGPISTGGLAFLLSILGIVGVVNALNLSDGLDGLAGGLSAIACLFLGYFAVVHHDAVCLAIIVVLFSCLMGFLYYNAYPAKLFMGDVGSLTLGFVLACVTILLVGKPSNGVQPISMAMVLGLPVMDTLIVMTWRVMQGLSPFLPDKTHLHHRLLSLGLPQSAVTPILYLVMSLYGVMSILLMGEPDWLQFVIGLCFTSCLYGVVLCMQRTSCIEKLGCHWQNQDGEDEWRKLEHRIFQRLTAISGRSIPIMTWLLPALLVFPLLSMQSMTPALSALCLILGLSMLMLFPWTAREDRVGYAHGLLYLSVVCLLAIYTLYAPHWVSVYLGFASAFVALWVVFKLVFKRHGRVFLTSGFEVLMIIVSWLFPAFLCSTSIVSPRIEQALYLVCLETIPFLLALKIVIRRQPRRNRPLVASLLGILLLVGVRAFL